jgi:hypothetical protein
MDELIEKARKRLWEWVDENHPTSDANFVVNDTLNTLRSELQEWVGKRVSSC